MLLQNQFEITTDTKQSKQSKMYKIKSKMVLAFTYSFALNPNSTILFTGDYLGKIRIYGFNVRQKLIQNLTYHTSLVGCLLFLKKSQSLVSGSEDKTIIIWNRNMNKQWNPQQILRGHTQSIQCIIVNQDEDLLISGALDKKIIFWQKEILNWRCKQTIDASDFVWCLSLSPSQKTLISCEVAVIRVMSLQSDQKWVSTQVIQIDPYGGYRLCFITDYQFVFQPDTQKIAEIYNYQEEKKQFIQTQQLYAKYSDDYNYYLPAQFISQKNTLIIQHGPYMSLFQVIQSNKFVLQQQLIFNCNATIFGRATDDGEYLVTWDPGSNEIQIRKYFLFLD